MEQKINALNNLLFDALHLLIDVNTEHIDNTKAHTYVSDDERALRDMQYKVSSVIQDLEQMKNKLIKQN